MSDNYTHFEYRTRIFNTFDGLYISIGAKIYFTDPVASAELVEHLRKNSAFIVGVEAYKLLNKKRIKLQRTEYELWLFPRLFKPQEGAKYYDYDVVLSFIEYIMEKEKENVVFHIAFVREDEIKTQNGVPWKKEFCADYII